MNAKTNRKQSLLRFQSNFVLPVARMTFLSGTALATLVVIIALLAVLFFQLKSMGSPKLVSVPPKQIVPLPQIDLSEVTARMSPPKQVRFLVWNRLIDGPVSTGTVLGSFQAETRNGLAHYPDDFTVMGGDSVDLFYKVKGGGNPPRSALAPTDSLVREITTLRQSLSGTETKTLSFKLKVVAKDVNGAYSAAADVDFDLVVGLAGERSRQAAPLPRHASPEPQRKTSHTPRSTDLQKLASEIASILDPEKTTRFFDHYKRAEGIPKECKATKKSQEFISAYRLAFEHVKEKLTPTTIEAFYVGLCDSWSKASREQAEAQSKANKIRNAAISKNRSAKTSHDLARIGYWSGRSMAFYVASGAFGVFLVLALSLAVFANENHAKVMRGLAVATRALEEAAKSRKSENQGEDDDESKLT